MWCRKHGWLQFCCLDFVSKMEKFGVSESLDQSLLCHGKSLSSEPLLQNAARNPLWIPAVFVLNRFDLIPMWCGLWQFPRGFSDEVALAEWVDRHHHLLRKSEREQQLKVRVSQYIRGIDVYTHHVVVGKTVSKRG